MELLDFYVANVMSGAFRPPSDPSGAEHTLAQLCGATVEKGEPSPNFVQGAGGIQVDYELRLDWAPVVARASTTTADPSAARAFPHFLELSPNLSGESLYTLVQRPFMLVRMEKLGGVAFLSLAIVEDRDDWMMHSGRLRLESVLESAVEKGYVAATAQTYFDQYEGWNKNDEDIWVPPTAGPTA